MDPEAEAIEEETQEFSVREALEASIEELSAETSDDAQTGDDAEAAEAEAAPTDDGKRARGADGKFAKKDNAEAAPTEAEPADTNRQADKLEGGSDGPPANWNEQGKALYAAAAPELQAYIQQRDAEQRQGVEKLKQTYEGAANFGNEMWKEFAPYQQIIQAEGGTPAGAMRDLLHTAALMRQGTPQAKRDALLQIAQQFNVDLGAKPTPDGQNDPAANPAYDALQREVLELRQQVQGVTQHTQHTQQTQTQALMSDIEAFKASSPHFEAVQHKMGQLISAGMAEGLHDAYEMAVRLDDNIQQQIQADTAAQEKAALAKAARDKAAAARRASGSINGTSVVQQSDLAGPNETVADTLKKTIAEVRGTA